MTTDIAALIAEADEVHGDDTYAAFTTMHRLRDALESLTASLSVSERSDATVTEVTAPATDDERGALVEAFAKAMNAIEARSHGKTLEDVARIRETWHRHRYEAERLIDELADYGVNAGFRRSSRVPVSLEELRAWAGMQLTGAPVNTTANGFLGADLFDAMHERYDIFPKADRKPADSGEAER